MLVDQAIIHVRAGKGGDGCLSFRRERFIPKGGPDGGDGGDGGSVYAVGTPGVETLLDFSGRHHWRAEKGRPGLGKNMAGRGGKDLYLKLPVGTLLYDTETELLIKDLATAGAPVCVAQGGKGGRGNARFASATNQTPREFEPGLPGEDRTLRLELKLIADVGIVGLPNAGKSTLLSRLSRARPKIADYPFTTLQPQLGIAELSDYRRVILADIPGLIEGAHKGAGLGDEFLRHIERTRVILHVVDVASDLSGMDPHDAHRVIREELAKYSPELAAKSEIVAANKIDLTDGTDAAQLLAEAVAAEVLPISAVTGQGLTTLLERLWALVQETKETPKEQSDTLRLPGGN